MAVRFDAAGDSLSRSTSVPNVRSFSVCGWAMAVVDNGAVAQPILAMLDGALQDGIALYWDNGFGNLELIVADAGGIFDNAILATSPATGQTFAWFVTCSGNGTNTVTAGYRLPGSNTWTTGTADISAAVADNASISFADVAGAQSFNGRLWNVKAWDAALTADQLLIESRFERMVFPANRNFHWPLYRHDALFDISGNGRNPTSGGTLSTEDAESGLWKSLPRLILPAFVAPPADPATAFQQGAFQSNAFQIYGGEITAPAGSIAGTSALVFTTAGAITGSGALAGTSAPAFATAGALTGSGALAGAISFAFTPTGAITGSGSLAGTAAMAFTTAGAVTGAGALAGTSTPAFTTSATLTGAGALAGTSALTFTTDGDLTNLGSGDISGTSALVFSLSAALTGAGALAGATTATFTPSATLTGSGALAGTSSLAFTTAGDVTGSGALAGTSSPAFSLAGELTGAVDLAGASSAAFTASATLTGAGALAGTSSPAFTTAGDLTGLAPGDIFGTSSLAFSVSGTLTGDGALAGASDMVFSTSLAFVEPETPQQVVNRAGGPVRRNYIVNGRKYYGLTNEELAYLLGHLQAEARRELVRDDVKVAFPSKKPHKISGNAWEQLKREMKVLGNDVVEWDEDEDAAMLLL